MKMATGYFSLFPIFDFAAHNTTIPSYKAKQVQSAYANLLKATVANVPDLPGWYLWGKFNDMGAWETTYLGKAGKQKTSSLHTRLYDELREDCIAFWAELYGREATFSINHATYDGRYDREARVSLNKFGTRFVMWISVEDAISEAEIMRQEILLMTAWQPTHNIIRRRNEDALPDDLTKKIGSTIEDELLRIIQPPYTMPKIGAASPA
jgi:hypothetical protein